MDDLIEIKFKDFIKLNRGFDLPEAKIIPGIYPIAASTSIKDYHNNFKVKAPCITTGRSGSLGTVLYINKECWPLNTTLYVKDFKGNYPRYVFYFLQMVKLGNFNSGAGVPSLNQNHLHSLKLKIHKKELQKPIADILANYDELIEYNEKRIVSLENFAEQIYKEWFVRLRFPGNKGIKSEKGIPEGWNVVPIGSLFSFYIGGGWGADQSSAEFPEPGYVIRGTDIPSASHGIPNKEVLRYHKPSNLKTRKLKPLDIVFEVSGGSADQWLGRNFLITQELLESYGGSVMCASFCKLIRPDVAKVSPYFLDQFLKLYYSTGLVSTFQVQSTGISNYQFEDFMKYQTIILPKENLLKKFSEIMEPIYSEINLLGRQLVILKKTRDLLLPRLISGKLRIKTLDELLITKG